VDFENDHEYRYYAEEYSKLNGIRYHPATDDIWLRILRKKEVEEYSDKLRDTSNYNSFFYQFEHRYESDK